MLLKDNSAKGNVAWLGLIERINKREFYIVSKRGPALVLINSHFTPAAVKYLFFRVSPSIRERNKKENGKVSYSV